MKQVLHRNGKGRVGLFRLLSVFVTLCLAAVLAPSQSIAYAREGDPGTDGGTLTTTASDVTVTASYGGGTFEGPVTLHAESIGKGDARYGKVIDALNELAETNDAFDYDNARALDIWFENEAGEEIEPKGDVQVSIDFVEGFSGNVVSTGLVHIPDDGHAELVEGASVETDGSGATFEADSFSVYVVTVEGAKGPYDADGQSFDTLQAAIDALAGKTGTITVTEQKTESGNFTIPAGTSVALKTSDAGKLTIKGSITVKGALELNDGIFIDSNRETAISVVEGGRLTVKGGEVTSKNTTATIRILSGSTLDTMSGGKVTVNSNRGAAILCNDGTIGSISDGELVNASASSYHGTALFVISGSVGAIEGGVFTGGCSASNPNYDPDSTSSTTGMGVFVGPNASLGKITKGTFSGSYGVVICGGKTTVSGGEFTGKRCALAFDRNGGGTITSGTFTVSAYNGRSGNGAIYNNGSGLETISNATITSKYPPYDGGAIVNRTSIGSITDTTIHAASTNGSSVTGLLNGPLNGTLTASIGSISRVTIEGFSICASNYAKGSIGTIESCTFTPEEGLKGERGLENSGSVTEITDSVFVVKPSSKGYGNGLTNSGTIQKISGGAFKGSAGQSYSAYGVENTGTIVSITGGEYYGRNAGLFNHEHAELVGTIGSITGGSFDNKEYGDEGIFNKGKIGLIDLGDEVASGRQHGIYGAKGSIDKIASGMVIGEKDGLYCEKDASIGSITGGNFMATGQYGVGVLVGGTVGEIAINEGTTSVFKGARGAVTIGNNGKIGTITGYGVFAGGACAVKDDSDNKCPVETTVEDSLDLELTGDNPGYGRYQKSDYNSAWDVLDNVTLPAGYHLSSAVTKVEGQEGFFQYLVKDNTVIYDGNGHDLTDPSLAAPGFPNRVFTTDAKAADNKTNFEFASGGKLFTGWNTVADGSGTAYKAGDDLTVPEGEELVLYAQWGNAHTITFDSNGGDDVEPIQVMHGGNVDDPPVTTMEGYVFEGWYTPANEKFSFKNITRDWTLKAKWSKLNTLTVTHYMDRTLNYYSNNMAIGALEFMGEPDYQPNDSEFYTNYDNYYNTYKDFTLKQLFDTQAAAGVDADYKITLQGDAFKIGALVTYDDHDYKLVKVTVNGTEITSEEGLNNTVYHLKDKNDVKFYYELIPVEIIVEGVSYEGNYDGASHDVSGFTGEKAKVWQYVSGQGTVGTDTYTVKGASDGAQKYRFAADGWEPSDTIRNVSAEAAQVLPAEDSGYKTWEKDGDYYIVPAGKYKLFYGSNKITNFDPTCYVIKWKPGTMKVNPVDLEITANDQEYAYDGTIKGEGDTVFESPEDIAAKVTIEGLKGSDALTAVTLDGQATYADTYPDQIEASNAKVGANGELNVNYSITYKKGTLTITEAEVTYASDNTSHGMVSLTSEKVGKVDTALAGSTATALEGYHFVNWTDDAEGAEVCTTAEYKPANLPGAYTAHFAANTYTVKFDKNADSAKGAMADQLFSYDEEKALPENGFTRDGYTFTGWNTEPDGSGDAYSDAQSVKNLTAEDGAAVTLYAQWEANVYTITFDPNGGEVEGSVEPFSADYEWGTEITVPEATREGYELLYWKGSEYQPGETYTVTEDHTFVAQWEKDEEPEPEPKPEPKQTPKPEPAKPGKLSPKRATPQTGDPAAAVPLGLFAGAGLGLLLVAAALRRRGA